VELREVGGAAVAGDDAAVAAVVGLAHRRVDADLGGDAADDEVLDAAFSRIWWRSVAWKAPLPGLSMTGSPAIG
jgi:hypothetical protein